MGAPVPTTQEPLTIDPTLRARLQEYQRRGRTDLQRSLLQSYEQARGLQPGTLSGKLVPSAREEMITPAQQAQFRVYLARMRADVQRSMMTAQASGSRTDRQAAASALSEYNSVFAALLSAQGSIEGHKIDAWKSSLADIETARDEIRDSLPSSSEMMAGRLALEINEAAHSYLAARTSGTAEDNAQFTTVLKELLDKAGEDEYDAVLTAIAESAQANPAIGGQSVSSQDIEDEAMSAAGGTATTDNHVAIAGYRTRYDTLIAPHAERLAALDAEDRELSNDIDRAGVGLPPQLREALEAGIRVQVELDKLQAQVLAGEIDPTEAQKRILGWQEVQSAMEVDTPIGAAGTPEIDSFADLEEYLKRNPRDRFALGMKERILDSDEFATYMTQRGYTNKRRAFRALAREERATREVTSGVSEDQRMFNIATGLVAASPREKRQAERWQRRNIEDYRRMTLEAAARSARSTEGAETPAETEVPDPDAVEAAEEATEGQETPPVDQDEEPAVTESREGTAIQRGTDDAEWADYTILPNGDIHYKVRTNDGTGEEVVLREGTPQHTHVMENVEFSSGGAEAEAEAEAEAPEAEAPEAETGLDAALAAWGEANIRRELRREREREPTEYDIGIDEDEAQAAERILPLPEDEPEIGEGDPLLSPEYAASPRSRQRWRPMGSYQKTGEEWEHRPVEIMEEPGAVEEAPEIVGEVGAEAQPIWEGPGEPPPPTPHGEIESVLPPAAADEPGERPLEEVSAGIDIGDDDSPGEVLSALEGGDADPLDAAMALLSGSQSVAEAENAGEDLAIAEEADLAEEGAAEEVAEEEPPRPPVTMESPQLTAMTPVDYAQYFSRDSAARGAGGAEDAEVRRKLSESLGHEATDAEWQDMLANIEQGFSQPSGGRAASPPGISQAAPTGGAGGGGPSGSPQLQQRRALEESILSKGQR